MFPAITESSSSCKSVAASTVVIYFCFNLRFILLVPMMYPQLTCCCSKFPFKLEFHIPARFWFIFLGNCDLASLSGRCVSVAFRHHTDFSRVPLLFLHFFLTHWWTQTHPRCLHLPPFSPSLFQSLLHLWPKWLLACSVPWHLLNREVTGESSLDYMGLLL